MQLYVFWTQVSLSLNYDELNRLFKLIMKRKSFKLDSYEMKLTKTLLIGLSTVRSFLWSP